MSHQLGLEGVYEKLVLLEHFSGGSQEYCRARLAGSEADQGDAALDDYWSWLKAIVSTYLIECAVRTRILQDTVRGDGAQQLAALDTVACEGLVVGTVVSGAFRLSLREACNKIIHATKAIPEWAAAVEGGQEFRYWNGDYRLRGSKGQDQWELILHVPAWARAMARFLDEARAAELTEYVGQDWY